MKQSWTIAIFVAIIGTLAMGASQPGCNPPLYIDFEHSGGELFVGELQYAGDIVFTPFQSGTGNEILLRDCGTGYASDFHGFELVDEYNGIVYQAMSMSETWPWIELVPVEEFVIEPRETRLHLHVDVSELATHDATHQFVVMDFSGTTDAGMPYNVIWEQSQVHSDVYTFIEETQPSLGVLGPLDEVITESSYTATFMATAFMH